MVKISNEELNKIRSSANIVDIISSYINLEPHGKNYFGICPFHDDHSPSMSVSEDKQIYKCFVCGSAGNVFTFIQNYNNVDFVTAVKLVADKIGYNLNVDTKGNNPNKKYYELMELANKYFINNLNSDLGKKAKEYLIKDRLLDESIIDEFKIGLALSDNNLNKLLSSKGYTDKEISNLSLANISENGLIDFFRNRITFPINNDKGDVVGFSARIFNGETNTGKYINSKESVIFRKGNILFNYDKCKSEAIKVKSVILCEGQMDAIRVYSSGIKNVCATMGTALTKEHIHLLKRLNSKVILMMDNDEAGEKATLDNGELLSGAGIEVLVVRLTKEKDPDTYILKEGIDAFRENINNASTFFDFKLNYLKKNKNLNKSEELAEYVNKVIDELNKSDDEILKAVTINKLAEDYGIDKFLLEAKLVKKEQIKDIPKVVKPKKKTSKYDKTAQTILYIMMNDEAYIKKFQNELFYFPDKTYKNIANDIIAFKEINGHFDIADFITYVNDFSYKDTILEIINRNEDLEKIELDFESFLSIIRMWIKEKQIEKLKEELKNETDIKRKEELNDYIIKLKRGSNE